jgi:hypothetical protein
VRAGAVVEYLLQPRAHFSVLQFSKAGNAVTLSQQKKNNTADVQRGRIHLDSGKLIPVATYLRRIRVAGCSFAAATAHDNAYTCGTQHPNTLNGFR